MSELRPASPARRPDTARPREDATPRVEPPSLGELERILRHLCSLPRHAGAIVWDEPRLGALLVRHPGGLPAESYVAMPRWTDTGWRASLEAAAALLRAEGTMPSLLLADRVDRPAGLADALPAAGWAPVHRETVHWVGHASVVPHLDGSLRLEAVQPWSVADHERLERAIFGLPEREATARCTALAASLAAGDLRAWVVRLDGQPVAVARLSQGEGVSGLYGIGVAEGRRRQGFATHITTIATRAALALGSRLVWLSVEEGNDAALGAYERLGFRPAFSWSRWMPLEG